MSPNAAQPLPSSGLVFTPRGVFNFAAQPAQKTSQDYRITAPLLNFGTVLFCKGATLGDSFDLYLVDVDGVYYPPGTVVGHFARSLFVVPDTLMETSNPAVPAPFSVGLYLRGTYTSTGQQNVNIIMNLRSYEQTADFAQDNT